MATPLPCGRFSLASTYLMVLRRTSAGGWLITHRMWDDPAAVLA